MKQRKIHETTEKILDEVLKKLHISPYELEQYIQQKSAKTRPQSFPIEILKTEPLSSLEAIVKYLRENENKRYKEISRLTSRNETSLPNTYKSARTKKSERLQITNPEKTIPFYIFSKKLSILEAICNHLYSTGLKYSEIGKLIGKDQRTIWTVCNRARKKLGGELK